MSRLLLALLLFVLVPSLWAEGQARVTVTDKIVGRTPLIIGINTGEMPQGSVFPEWIRALGVNGARLRLNVDPADFSLETMPSLTAMESRAATLRSQAEKETPILWTHPAKVAAPPLQALRAGDVELLATITCPFAYHLLESDGKTNWSQAWRFWKSYYAQAYQLARQHQVRRYQLFNEPNHRESLKLSQAEYSARMALGCDAIQAALTDASRDGGQKLEPLISAPCTAGIGFFTRSGKPEARDEKIGWGELSMRDLHLRPGGKTSPGYSQFQQYAVQTYSTKPGPWVEQLNQLAEQVRQANGGRIFPLVMSEFNIHTARDFAKLATTMDSPEEFSALGSMAVAIAESGLEELYFFRLTLSKNLDGDGVKKNGIHHVHEGGPVPEITGTTGAAEVIRLVTPALKGGRELLEIRMTGGIRAAASRNRDDLRVLLARTNATLDSEVKISLPRLAENSLLTWQTVTGTSMGTVKILDVPTRLQDLTVDLPGTSVGLLAVQSVASLSPARVTQDLSRGTEPGRLTTGGTGGASTLFRFPALSGPTPAAAFLCLKARSPGTSAVPVHLYRLTSSGSDEKQFQGGNFSFLRSGSSLGSEPFAQPMGQDLQWVGAFAVEPGTREVCVDVTSAVARAQNQTLAWVLTRDRRSPADKLESEPVEWQTAELMVYSR